MKLQQPKKLKKQMALTLKNNDLTHEQTFRRT